MNAQKKVEIVPGLEVKIASAEDVILGKLLFYFEGRSEKHLNDIRDILMNVKVDDAYLNAWAEKLRVMPEWQLAQNSGFTPRR